MTRHSLIKRRDQALGEAYWAKRKGEDQRAERMIRKAIETSERILTGDYVPELNERGNRVFRHFRPQRGRYYYDLRLKSEQGWKQFDTEQDFNGFGVWVNERKRMTLCYCEGDVTLVTCPDLQHFKAELADAERFYGAPPPCAVGIDRDGTVTRYYDDRPTAAAL